MASPANMAGAWFTHRPVWPVRGIYRPTVNFQNHEGLAFIYRSDITFQKRILRCNVTTFKYLWLQSHCTADSQPFRFRANSLTGANRPIEPWPICSLELSLHGPFNPWPSHSLERARERKDQAVICPGSKLVRVLLADSLQGANGPLSEKASYRTTWCLPVWKSSAVGVIFR